MEPENEPAPSAGPNIQPKYKIVFLGDTYVGKTCLIHRFMYDTFKENYEVTIGIDFLSKSMCVEDKVVKLQLWDTAGQERFRSLIPNYLREAAAAIVVYDVTNKASFASVKQWVTDARNLQGDNMKMMLVGNKVDLADKRQVSTDEGMKLAKELGLMFIETSSKDGTNVYELFKTIAASLPGLEGAEITSSNDGTFGQRYNQVVVGLQLTQQTAPPARRGCC